MKAYIDSFSCLRQGVMKCLNSFGIARSVHFSGCLFPAFPTTGVSMSNALGLVGPDLREDNLREI